MPSAEDANPKSELDPELMALAGGGPRPSILRPILMIAVIVLAGWIVGDWRGELEYYFSDKAPIELGDALEYASGADGGRKVSELPQNRYVKMSGIPTQRSQSDRYRFFRLVGAPVFVEQPRDDIIEDPLERELEGDVKGDVDRTLFTGQGRLTSFASMPERYGGLRHYYRTRYNIIFCETLAPSAHAEIARRKRDAVIAQLKAEYAEATPEQRERQKLTPEPDPAVVEALLADDPVCIDAYLLQDGEPPENQIWYLVMSIICGFFMLFNTVMLVRWFRDFFRA